MLNWLVKLIVCMKRKKATLLSSIGSKFSNLSISIVGICVCERGWGRETLTSKKQCTVLSGLGAFYLNFLTKLVHFKTCQEAEKEKLGIFPLQITAKESI